MITFLHSDLYRFGRYANRVFGQHHRIKLAWILPTNDGVEMVMADDSAVLRVRHENVHLEEKAVIPWQLIKEIGEEKSDTVNIVHEEQNVTAQYSVRGIPKTANYPCPTVDDVVLPALPATQMEKPDAFLDILVDCSKYTDAESARYALGGICLDGTKQTIGAVDGRIGILHSGHVFPWVGEVIAPQNKIYAMKEFRGNETINIGMEGDWFALKSGHCIVQLKKIDGRFPKLEKCIPAENTIATWINMDDADAVFLMSTINNLPNEKHFEKPITLDASNGVVAILAAEDNGDNVTELLLAGSAYSGDDARGVYNRDYFKQLLKSGFRRLGLQKDCSTPLLACGNMVSGVVMPLSGETLSRTDNRISVSSTDHKKMASPVRETPGLKKKIEAPMERPQPQPMIKETSKTMNAPKHTPVSVPAATATDYDMTTQEPENMTLLQNAMLLEKLHRHAMKVAQQVIRQSKKQAKQNQALKTAMASFSQIQQQDLAI